MSKLWIGLRFDAGEMGKISLNAKVKELDCNAF